MVKLTDFQQETADYIFERLSSTNCQRLLCADEVGLGKTIIAKGVIEHFLKKKNGSLKVFYVCSSQFLAQQNLTKLHPLQQKQSISRLTEIITRPDLTKAEKGLQILPLSPQTSVDMKSRGGKISERAILYHLLKQYDSLSGRWNDTYERVLGLGIKGWWNEVRAIESIDLDEKITNKFLSLLKKDAKINRLLTGCFDGTSTDYRKLIGDLRQLLAVAALTSLKPDLIILDEFQRFSDILKQSEDENASDLIKVLFANNQTKMLMLSATPYKMFTIREEHLEENSHYEEFHFLMKFLMRADYNSFLKEWTEYTDALLSLHYHEPNEIEVLKTKVEKRLYDFVCRTERNIVYGDKSNSSLIESKYFSLPFTNRDIENFIITDEIAKCIQQEPEYEDIYSPLEYCKTAPYPLSFMEHYKIKKVFRELLKSKPKYFGNVITKNENAFVKYDEINAYSDKVFPNAKMQWLADENVKSGSLLLWVPPALSYYKLEGAFENSEGFSKVMIFGRFAVEPRAISLLASYKVECLTTGSKAALKYTQEKKPRQYFTSDYEAEDVLDNEDVNDVKRFARQPRRRLYFKNDDSSYSLLCFYYPSVYLSKLVNQTLKIDSTCSLEFAKDKLELKIKDALHGLEQYSVRKGERTDARWYLFALLYLDYTFENDMWSKCVGDSNRQKAYRFGIHRRAFKIYDYAKIIQTNGLDHLAQELSLGNIPSDLCKVMTIMALGNPTTLLYQTFLQSLNHEKFTEERTPLNLSWFFAFGCGEGFRSFYNLPEHISVIDISCSNEKYDYWINLMEYNASGCLKAVLDECFYTYTDGNLTWDSEGGSFSSFSTFLFEILSLRTSSLDVDMAGENGNILRQAMRTHYAIAFTDQQETDENIARKKDVQNSFNSPFRPFILATTSIGQEGLDFHKYCRQLLHWSLPGNAIDLEQREGRINRYKHYSLRLNLIERYREEIQDKSLDNPIWNMVIKIAENDFSLKANYCDLVPYWHVPLKKYPLERLVPLYPFSKDAQKLEHLLRTLTVYRLSLGQSNQEDLVNYFLKNFTQNELEHFQAKLMINLSPIARKH